MNSDLNNIVIEGVIYSEAELCGHSEATGCYFNLLTKRVVNFEDRTIVLYAIIKVKFVMPIDDIPNIDKGILDKGNLVTIKGSLAQNSHEAKDGETIMTTYIRAESIMFAGVKRGEA